MYGRPSQGRWTLIKEFLKNQKNKASLLFIKSVDCTSAGKGQKLEL